MITNEVEIVDIQVNIMQGEPWWDNKSSICWVFLNHRMEPLEVFMTSDHFELAHHLLILKDTEKEEFVMQTLYIILTEIGL